MIVWIDVEELMLNEAFRKCSYNPGVRFWTGKFSFYSSIKYIDRTILRWPGSNHPNIYPLQIVHFDWNGIGGMNLVYLSQFPYRYMHINVVHVVTGGV